MRNITFLSLTATNSSVAAISCCLATEATPELQIFIKTNKLLFLIELNSARFYKDDGL